MLCADGFDWADDADIAVCPQAGIAVYPNKRCEIVVREQDDGMDGADTALVLNLDAARAVVRRVTALIRAIEKGEIPREPDAEAAPLLSAGSAAHAP